MVTIESMWNTVVGIKNCKLFSLRVAFTTQKKATRAAEMMSVERVAIFWVLNASSGEKSCLQFLIPTGSRAGGEGGVSHTLNSPGKTSPGKILFPVRPEFRSRLDPITFLSKTHIPLYCISSNVYGVLKMRTHGSYWERNPPLQAGSYRESLEK